MTRTEFASSQSDVGSKESAGGGGVAALKAVLNTYIAGKTPLPGVRRELIKYVGTSHERAVSMLHYLRAAYQAGLITNAALHILSTDVQVAVYAGTDEAVATSDARRDEQRALQSARSASRHGRLLAGRFEIKARVGEGGIGEVFLAHDLRRVEAGLADPRVAIKMIRREHDKCAEAIRSLQREAVNAQCLVHPGIRRVYELDRHRKRFFIVMEWLDGETLAERLDRTKGRPMGADAFRTILRQTASALSFAHRYGIVHGDIKPGNVFVAIDGSVKLLDLGHTEGIPALGSEPFAISRGYSSVELHSGGQPEIRDDVYSLAVMAYRMFVGRRPFAHHNAVEAEMLGLEAAKPPMLSPRQWGVLRAGLALRREHRLATVAELCDGLLLSPIQPSDRLRLVSAA